MTMVDVESRLTALESEVAELRRMLEQSQIAAAMKKSIAQIERGEGKPAIQFAQSLDK